MTNVQKAYDAVYRSTDDLNDKNVIVHTLGPMTTGYHKETGWQKIKNPEGLSEMYNIETGSPFYLAARPSVGDSFSIPKFKGDEHMVQLTIGTEKPDGTHDAEGGVIARHHIR